jgi:hypothetical protein
MLGNISDQVVDAEGCEQAALLQFIQASLMAGIASGHFIGADSTFESR